jgi:isopenicillin-N N-acyltransferase-like protein
MNTGKRYREIEVRGTPLEMGRQLGEAACEELHEFDAVLLERANLEFPIERETAMSLAARCVQYVENYAPAMLDELRGISQSSGLTMEQLMLLQVRNQLRPQRQDEGCTAFALKSETCKSGSTTLGQNWDNDPGLDPFTVILTRRPQDEPAHINITQVGRVAYIGFSEAGIGVCLNALPSPSRELGVPHYFTVRGIYQSRSLEQAVEAVRRAERAIPANILLSTPQGLADLEVTIDDVHVLHSADNGVLTHANHCLHPQLTPVKPEFDDLMQSCERQRRMDELLSTAAHPFSLEQLQSVLSDHDEYPTSICRHPNEDPTTGYCRSVFSVIMEVDEGRMHVSRGNPCDTPYQTYRLN